MRSFPSPDRIGEEFAAKRPLVMLPDDPWVSVSSLVTGLDNQQEQNTEAATACCVSVGSFYRPPSRPSAYFEHIQHIYFI